MEWKKALAVTDLEERKVVKVEGHKILFIKQKFIRHRRFYKIQKIKNQTNKLSSKVGEEILQL